jgi:hypothetical protein
MTWEWSVSQASEEGVGFQQMQEIASQGDSGERKVAGAFTFAVALNSTSLMVQGFFS